MGPKQREISRTLQVILWLWFGIITSFVATNVVNIARLQLQYDYILEQLNEQEKILKQYSHLK
jgi:hypothetical protein